MRDLIWQFYADLKAYRSHPTKRRKTALRARFDRIFALERAIDGLSPEARVAVRRKDIARWSMISSNG